MRAPDVGVPWQSLGRRTGNPATTSLLGPDVQLDVLLPAICGRSQYTHDPAPVIGGLTAASCGRANILGRVAGFWSGYVESPERAPLTAAHPNA
ncbi:hypothetical protein [Microbacterium sp. cf332]|uniref:hypothetical protein n=1 Tax=Microbacterium sp. cf332 TaxID=1761804 RepID=UPI00088F7C45|nr:hypothetical protein [Microbacterium sp. cf332]SDQ87427.1 hypothetical protein SAMN04487847_2827 [Microbacterium sp. cf332]